MRGTKLGPLPATLGSLTGVVATPSGNLVISVENAVVDVVLH